MRFHSVKITLKPYDFNKSKLECSWIDCHEDSNSVPLKFILWEEKFRLICEFHYLHFCRLTEKH
jgi:hypothetical protein